MNTAISTITVQFMSSKEISLLCKKTHKAILRNIRDIFKELDGAILHHEQYQQVTDNRGYTIEYFLDKELSLLVVSGYSLKLRHAIIKRWQSLETQVSRIPPQLQRYTERVATVPVKHFIACLYFFFQVVYN